MDEYVMHIIVYVSHAMLFAVFWDFHVLWPWRPLVCTKLEIFYGKFPCNFITPWRIMVDSGSLYIGL